MLKLMSLTNRLFPAMVLLIRIIVIIALPLIPSFFKILPSVKSKYGTVWAADSVKDVLSSKGIKIEEKKF